MKSAQKGFIFSGLSAIVGLLQVPYMTNHALGALMIGLSLTALMLEYRSRIQTTKAVVRPGHKNHLK